MGAFVGRQTDGERAVGSLRDQWWRLLMKEAKLSLCQGEGDLSTLDLVLIAAKSTEGNGRSDQISEISFREITSASDGSCQGWTVASEMIALTMPVSPCSE